MLMRAGTLNRRIRIEHFTEVYDPDYGPQPGDWETLAAVWASIKQLSGLKTVEHGLELSIVKSSIRIRYRTDITAGMRVVHGTTAYDIKAVLMDEAGRQFTDLVCTSWGEQG